MSYNMIVCDKGHEHFGKLGAAGILIYRYRASGEVEMLLGKRSASSHDGDSWSTIGGAIDQGETPQAAALRELKEEISLDGRATLELTGVSFNDHGSWVYTTYLATPKVELDITKLKLEETEITALQWYTRKELGGIKLNSGFATTAQVLKTLLPPDADPLTGDVAKEYAQMYLKDADCDQCWKKAVRR
ncbi:hypothetical protein F4776DRAFT_660217 [Hypoxylon sp. NC0597]|nr:hypothetical protein F4776DRAFT_660217 [Hypoxylon sp. NC0597]